MDEGKETQAWPGGGESHKRNNRGNECFGKGK